MLGAHPRALVSVALTAVARTPRAALALATTAAVRALAPVARGPRALARPAIAAPAPAGATGANAGELLDGLAGDVRVLAQAQADAPALAVDLDHAHVDLIALVEHVLDAVHALSGRDVGDVQQPIGALGELDERAEGRRLDDLADVLVADLDLLHHHPDALHELVPELAVGGVDQHLSVVVDVDLRLELVGEAPDRFAALADQQADLRGVDLDRLDARGELAELLARTLDHLGDMDFKVAGTERGITALQMDIKITGVTFDILRDALAQAKEARTFILGKMVETIQGPRTELSQFAPRIQTIQIDPSQIGLLIGKGGETIRGLAEEFESQIDVNDDGQVLIYSANGELGDALLERIRMMMKEVEVGDEYLGKVVKTTTFGAFVELAKGTDGLLHISNVSPGQRVETVEDVLNKGDEINVRVVEVDRERGRIGLRLAEDPDVAGKSAQELAGVGSGGGGGGSRPPRDRDGGGRNGSRDRGRSRDGERGSGRPRHDGSDRS